MQSCIAARALESGVLCWLGSLQQRQYLLFFVYRVSKTHLFRVILPSRGPPPPKCTHCYSDLQSGYKYLQRGARHKYPTWDPPPGWSFALRCKFEFWAHAMKSLHNAKLHSSANIGEGGGSLLGRIPVKNHLLCMVIVSDVKQYLSRGILPTRGPPPPPKCTIC